MYHVVTNFRTGMNLRDYWAQILLFEDEEPKAQNGEETPKPLNLHKGQQCSPVVWGASLGAFDSAVQPWQAYEPFNPPESHWRF